MILSNEEYYIHTQTRNISFIKMARYLKDRGIENYSFMLKLYDKDLMKVNPHARNLSPITKSKIIVECTRNPWYALRECYMISAPGGSRVFFELHPGNLAIIWAILLSLSVIVLLPRQRGKTISIATVLSYIFYFGTKNTAMLFGNKSGKDAENNLARFKDITLGLPSYLRDTFVDSKDTDNVTQIVSVKRNNKIDIHGQPVSEEAADKQG